MWRSKQKKSKDPEEIFVLNYMLHFKNNHGIDKRITI